MSNPSQTFEFQAETRQLMDLMIHSIYSHKEIFLRELISNASDAIDKRKFLGLTDKTITQEANNFIRIEVDKTSRRLIISDTGIGMSRDEVVAHIGTIAKSGTKEILEQAKSSANPVDLIGQFGVGFYSAFMVADKITLVTRRADSPAGVRWVSTGAGTYTVEEEDKPTVGTTITLDLKPADKENGLPDFCDEFEIESVVKKYSDFIAYPILMKKEVFKTVGEGENAKSEKTIEEATLNSMKPIWTRSKSDVKEDEYNEFYKHISHDWEDPLKVISYKAEGRIEYTALLYLPKRAPFDLYYTSFKGGLQLYVKKVLILERAEELLPRYLRFVKGVIESADLPLNISREILQQDRHITAIRKGLTTKVISVLTEMLEKDRDKYAEFYREFGAAMKEGASTDFENKEKLAGLLLFASSHDKEKTTTLAEYVGRMKDGQKDIYFLSGDSRVTLENSPHTESLRAKGYEILYLIDAYDEIVLQNIGEFSGKKFKSANKGELDLADEKEKEKDSEKLKEADKAMGTLLGALKQALTEQVKDVKFTTVLVSAPSRVVGDDFDLSPYLEKILTRNGEKVPPKKKTLEINPDHEIVKKLFAHYDKNPNDPMIADYAQVLWGHAVIADGGDVGDVGRFNKALLAVATKGLE
ncbi:MAG: molecular chaperone HtpG [Leptospiraceae bacterium]|nr:molecular chaperone HtpG [Leptospiraceae bacterium]